MRILCLYIWIAFKFKFLACIGMVTTKNKNWKKIDC